MPAIRAGVGDVIWICGEIAACGGDADNAVDEHFKMRTLKLVYPC